MSPVLAPAHAPVFAEIRGLTVESTGVVPTVKPVLVWPAGTVTVDGNARVGRGAGEAHRLTACGRRLR